MLAKLSVKNVALIESAEIEFSEGLNVLSGETGAGRQFFSAICKQILQKSRKCEFIGGV